MVDQVNTNRGRTIAISTTAQNDDLADGAAFAALSFTPIGGVGSIGEYGINTNVLTYDTLDRITALKQKGITNAGDPEIECARDSGDAGQVAMSAAGDGTVYDAYAFQVTNQDGSIDYLRGIVVGPRRPGGRNEDFDLDIFQIGVNQLLLDA